MILCLMMFLSAGIGNANEPRAVAETLIRGSGLHGGLIVHIGCGDGSLTAELSQEGKYLVHGLSSDRDQVERAREKILAKELYGSVSVEYNSLKRLHYTDNLVNLVVSEDLGEIPMDEVMRVLCPKGTAYIRKNGAWMKREKPWPEDIDEWTHERYSPHGNAVSSDTRVGPPRSLQWVHGPLWSQSKKSFSAMLSSGGRNFYIEHGVLYVKDAYNGMPLWKKAVHSGARQLIAAGDRVFSTSNRATATVRDAVTGKLLRTFPSPKGSRVLEMMLYHKGDLLLAWRKAFWLVDASSGDVKWKRNLQIRKYRENIRIGDGQVFLVAKDLSKKDTELRTISLDFATGRDRWRTKNYGYLCSYHDGLLTCGATARKAGSDQVLADLHVLSAKDGSLRWSYQYPLIGHGGGPLNNNLFSGGLIWVHRDDPLSWQGHDPATGEVKKVFKYSGYPGGRLRHGCYKDRASANYLLSITSSLVDWKNLKHAGVPAIRGTCHIGFMPANGLLYTAPQACMCYPHLKGYVAVSPAEPVADKPELAERFIKGPAFGKVTHSTPHSALPIPQSSDWPMYRKNALRCGATADSVSTDLRMIWETDLGSGPLTPPTVAGGIAFVAVPGTHQVAALDSTGGKKRWTFQAGAPVDTPPTVYKGLCLFGSRDGWLYCLRAKDGTLVWRFRAAPVERRIAAFGGIESPWPLSGSVLVVNDIAYAAAGRHSYMDGGIFLYAIEPSSGKVIWETQVHRGAGNPVNDLLVSDGQNIYMSDWHFDSKTGKGGFKRGIYDLKYRKPYLRAGISRGGTAIQPFSLLFDSTRFAGRQLIERSFWRYQDVTGYTLVFSKSHAYGFSSHKDKGLILFGKTSDPRKANEKEQGSWAQSFPWKRRLKSVLLAKSVLFAAGAGETGGAENGALLALSSEDGTKQNEIQLAGAPVFDGMAAAGGRIYVSTQNGKLICLAE